MSAARFTLVTFTVLCFLSAVLTRPHEKKHKHKHQRQIEIPAVIDESKKDIVLSDDAHLPKEHKTKDVNLAFDILTPDSFKQKSDVEVKESNYHNIFLDQEAVSFGQQKNEKSDLWHNLYEIKEPESDKDDLDTKSHVESTTKLNTQKVQSAEKDKQKTVDTETSVKSEGKAEETSEEDEDGIEDDYDDLGDYYDYDEYNEENTDTGEKIKDQKSDVSAQTNDEKEDNSGEKAETSEVKSQLEKDSQLPSDAKVESLEELINEIYGGVLPYSASLESIEEQIKGGNKGSKVNTGKNVKNSLKEKDVKEEELTSEEVENDNSVNNDVNYINLGNVGGLSSQQDSLKPLVDKPVTPKTIPTVQKEVRDVKTTTNKPSVTAAPSNNSLLNTQKKEESDSKLNASFKTPNVAETSPNPPTTKAVSVTAAPNKAVKEYIQSKPLQLCMDDGGCSPGRMCHSGICVCGDATMCKSHHSISVCGSDGQLYPSHCELHRHACLKQMHIRVNHDGHCGQDMQQSFKIQPTYEGTQCEYRVFKGQEGILWGDLLVPVQVKSLLECSNLCDKKSYEDGCFAFQYSTEKSGLCYLFEKPTDIIRHPNADMDFYEQRRCKANPDTKCDYEPVNLVAEHIYAMCNVITSTVKSYDECRDLCHNCTAFTYKKKERICEIHHSKACIDMMNALGIVHYIKRCNKKGDICHVLEVIPGKSPFMCSRASSSVSSLIECHDACVHGRCEAFQFLTMKDKTTMCEIFFDRSCIDLLDKKKENYYVKRCTNPKDCDYHQIQSASMMPCRVTASDMDTMEKCRNMCNVDTCFGFHYNYDSLKCELYSDRSCVLGKNLNYVIRKCHTKEEKPDIPQQNDLPAPNPPAVQDVAKTTKQPEKTTTPSTLAPIVDEYRLPNHDVKKGDIFCHEDDYKQFKVDLLRYHCVRFREKHCDEAQIHNKGYIASLMFSYFDRDMNNEISNNELWEMQIAEGIENVSTICTLLDLLKYEARGQKLDHTTFLKAFILEEPLPKEEITVVPVTSTADNGLEIRCSIPKKSEIIWKRNDIDLTSVSVSDLAVFSDGTLYFEVIGLHHVGNYTCFDKMKPNVKEVHALHVNVKPKVKVSPSSMTLKTDHLDLYIDCHVDGLPQPTITWDVNSESVPNNQKHYITTHHNGTLMIQNVDIQRDQGTYRCTATNQAGSSRAEAVLSPPGSPEKLNMEAFYVFHKGGYTAYEPKGCETIRHVQGDFGNLKYIPEELDLAPSMCGIGQQCEWGAAVNVQNKYIYSTQPEHNRIIVIDVVNSFNPVQIVKTDKYPVKLYYVEHLDEVWVLCWNADHDSGSKTVVVIRDASKDIRHHIVHTQPIGYRFDLVEDIFVPPQNDLAEKFNHGYVIHKNQRGLFKIDLESMRYNKAIDLEKEDCIPKTLAYIPIGGYIVIECQRPVQIILDYITDHVISTLPVSGTPYVSPDSRHLVFVQKHTGIVTVYSIELDSTLSKEYEVTTGSAVSDATFYPSDLRSGYDLFLADSADDNIYSIRLDNGQVTTITGKNEVDSSPVWPWSMTSRMIASGDYFSQYLASPTKSKAIIFNGRDKSVHCSYPSLESPDQIVYVRVQ